ncbi:TPA: hypothetical protein O9O01_004554 [Escherichia coli]|uniref:hypothetical protein n=1 Tax=Escherichia coli TaxID=562 RepID=UPI000DA45A08|nr:hypothetical protein [Escherichia coli]MDD8174201.1 hypothetical protein [Escherichia coli]MEC3734353.1 hypothetical protein [Escherichia coli]MQJ16233.1 hypothetical protein [Escherichia coli]SQN95527.1 Uncharacterised protein [Escherichia coli]HAV2439695.1 hypothetical protein [Escherichia coli]
MFKSIKKMFTGDKAEQQPQQPQGFQPLWKPDHVFTDAEFKAIEIAHKPVFNQIAVSNARGDTAIIQDEKAISPWVIGYMVGILDQVTQRIEGKQHAALETMAFFVDYHFAPELRPKVWGCYFAAQSMAGKPNEPFYPMYESFIEGAQAGYECFPNQEHGAPKLALYWALNNGGYPPAE